MGQGISGDNKKDLDTVQLMIRKAATDSNEFHQLMEVKDTLERSLAANQPFAYKKRRSVYC